MEPKAGGIFLAMTRKLRFLFRNVSSNSCSPAGRGDIECLMRGCLSEPLGGLRGDTKPCILRVVDLPARRILVTEGAGDWTRDYQGPRKTDRRKIVKQLPSSCQKGMTRNFYFSL